MGMPLKVSESLLAVAKSEAEMAHRSMTAQVEYWARIGRAVEVLLGHNELLQLKKAGELLTPVFPSQARRREVHDMLVRIAASADRDTAKARIRANKQPVYSSDPAHPGLIVKVFSDGTRILGRLEGRTFLPAREGSAKNSR